MVAEKYSDKCDDDHEQRQTQNGRNTGQQGDRYSVVQFAHPTPWTMLAPIGTCVSAETPLRYPTISSADALDKVLWEINLVEDGRRVGE